VFSSDADKWRFVRSSRPITDPQVSFSDRLAASAARGLDKTLTKRSLVTAQGKSSTLGRDPGCYRPNLLQATFIA
jgi:hypothetical protein